MRYACGACRKKFRTEGALEMHNQSKHKARITQGQRSSLLVPVVSISICQIAAVRESE